MVAYRRFTSNACPEFKVVKTENNDRSRSRISSRKPFDIGTTNEPFSTSFFDKGVAEFAEKWAKECAGDKYGYALPSGRQVFAGLQQCYMLNLQRTSTAATNATLPSVIKTYQRVFETILALVAFTDPDQKFNRWDGDEYSLHKPDTKACYSVVWMYSLEPPLYWLLNRAMRTKNMAYLQMLGPFAQAIRCVLGGAEE